MNLVTEFQDEGGRNREALNIDKRGQYYIDEKPVSVADAFRWYARRSARPAMAGGGGDARREGQFLKRVGEMLKLPAKRADSSK